MTTSGTKCGKFVTPEGSADRLKRTIETQHGGTATFIQSVPIKETKDGKTVWKGTVFIFALADNKLARRAYAWSSHIEGSTKRRFFAVLHIRTIDSPVAAVRAAIVAEHRKLTGYLTPLTETEMLVRDIDIFKESIQRNWMDLSSKPLSAEERRAIREHIVWCEKVLGDLRQRLQAPHNSD